MPRDPKRPPRQCPTHPGHDADECGLCEAAIARAELRRDDPGDAPKGWYRDE